MKNTTLPVSLFFETLSTSSSNWLMQQSKTVWHITSKVTFFACIFVILLNLRPVNFVLRSVAHLGIIVRGTWLTQMVSEIRQQQQST